MSNLIFNTDSYKMPQFKMYPKGTEYIYSYLESRGGRFDWSVFFGLQAIIKENLIGKVITKEKIDEAEIFAKKHFGTLNNTFNREGWEYILKEHDGKLPLQIKAIPEGTVLKTKNVLVTVENTDPNCFWLTNYIETLLVRIWYPITVATQSWHMREIIRSYLDETGDVNLIDFKLHDFGARGVSSLETAGIGGAAHLTVFKGTDTIEGILCADKYYNSDVCGFSIPASEHSNITSFGKENELDAYKNILEQFPNGMVACVSDSFDIFKAVKDYWGDELRYEVNKREGTLIVRPDSGEPTEIVPKVLSLLGEQFGYETNEKGYKVLNPKVRVIQGDGIDFDTLPAIMDAVRTQGWSVDNLAFGSGGGLLQKLNRDTMRFAFKCSSITINGEEHDVFKSPITDKVKVSKKGRLKLVNIGGSHGSIDVTVNQNEPGEDILQTVFLNGDLLIDQNFDIIRKRVDNGSALPRYLGYNFGLKT